MSKPTDDTQWATGASPELAEPSTGQKQTGWTHSTKPPAHWFNWMMRAYYRWIAWFDAVLSTDDHNTISVTANGSATRAAITGTGGNSKPGISAYAASSGSAGAFYAETKNSSSPAVIIDTDNGYGVYIQVDAGASGTPTHAPVHIYTGSQPAGPNEVGDLYVTSAGVLKICTVAGTPGTWVSVGTQT